MSPALMTASMAVESNSGFLRHSARADVLGHPHLHAALRRAPHRHVVHELANQEDAAAARAEHVLGCQRILHGLGIETGPWSRTETMKSAGSESGVAE